MIERLFSSADMFGFYGYNSQDKQEQTKQYKKTRADQFL